MKLNIKNARRLESTLDEQINRLVGKIKSQVSYSTSKDALEGTITNIDTVLEKLTNIRGIRSDIRNAIGLFNESNGINKVTSLIAVTSSELEIFEMISEIGNPSSYGGYSSTSPTTYSSGLDEDTREQYYTKTLVLKREIQRLKDKCQGINSSGTIELSSEQESFLKKFGLMD